MTDVTSCFLKMTVQGGWPPSALCAWVVLLLLVVSGEPYRTPYDQEQDQNRERTDHRTDPRTNPRYANPHYPQQYPQYQAVPQINITILKGEKGDSGQRGPYGKSGKSGQSGPRGPNGIKGTKGSIGTQGEPCKVQYAAFSVGRKKAIHSNDYYQTLVFDTELVNLYGHFNMFTGKFYCYVPGIYYFSLNVHTWNQKETYVHVMHNEREVVILYAQPSDRSIMQSQSLMLQLERDDQ
ncbi:unnamed protein product, partial [Coregonus sp. 'balchen']